MNINYLRIPIGYLHDIDDVSHFYELFNKSAFEEDMRRREKSDLEGIMKALEWAEENPNYDFASMLPDINHKNKDIYEYLCKFHNELSNIDTP